MYHVEASDWLGVEDGVWKYIMFIYLCLLYYLYIYVYIHIYVYIYIYIYIYYVETANWLRVEDGVRIGQKQQVRVEAKHVYAKFNQACDSQPFSRPEACNHTGGGGSIITRSTGILEIRIFSALTRSSIRRAIVSHLGDQRPTEGGHN